MQCIHPCVLSLNLLLSLADISHFNTFNDVPTLVPMRKEFWPLLARLYSLASTYWPLPTGLYLLASTYRFYLLTSTYRPLCIASMYSIYQPLLTGLYLLVSTYHIYVPASMYWPLRTSLHVLPLSTCLYSLPTGIYLLSSTHWPLLTIWQKETKHLPSSWQTLHNQVSHIF